jgi:hypothetical protein
MLAYPYTFLLIDWHAWKRGVTHKQTNKQTKTAGVINHELVLELQRRKKK